MFGLLFLLAAGAAIAFGALFLVIAVVLRLVFGLILLPFRLLALLLWLPFLLVKLAIAAVVGVAIGVPVLIGGLGLGLLALVFVPLLPFVAIAALLYLLVRASARPALAHRI